MNRIKYLISASLMAVTTLTAQAVRLTPQQAIQRVQQERTSPTGPMRAVSSSALHLIYPLESIETTNIYVFAPKDAQGYVVLSADDAIGNLVLGYSDTDTFDPTDMPPALQWLMECYSQSIDNAAAHAPMRISRTPMADISPIIKTKWNQDSPYNDDCPVIDGKRAYTGCVATAYAQIMKHYRWPECGHGSISYKYEHDNQEYQETYDFDNTVFDWDNMTDTYGSSSTSDQRVAVATLMHAVGAAAKMSYGPEGSSANSAVAAQGLTDYFDYDNGVSCCQRKCYSQDEWEDILYGQLAQGMPVVYNGTKMTGEGHAFICDGYKDSYYHINWGWGGYSDTYYDLSLLFPTSQGIGSGSGDGGFSYNQSMVINIRPQQGGEYKAMMGAKNLYTTEYTYGRDKGTVIPLYGPFCNMSVRTVTYDLGVEVVQSGVSKGFVAANTYGTLSGGAYFDSYNMPVSNLPTGKYEIYPAYKEKNGEWTRMKCDPTNPNIPIRLTVNNSQVMIEKPANAQGTLTAELVSSVSLDPNDNGYYLGHTYDLTWLITCKDGWNQDVSCGIICNGAIYPSENLQRLTLEDGESASVTFRVDVSNSIKYANCEVCLYYVDDNTGYLRTINNRQDITISTRSKHGNCQWTDITLVGSINDGTDHDCPGKLYASNCAIDVTISCTDSPMARDIYLGFASTTSNTIISWSERQYVELTQYGETTTVTFKGPWPILAAGSDYRVSVWSDGIQLEPYYMRYFTMYDGDPLPEILDINTYYIDALVDEAVQIEATILPEIAAYGALTWTSSDDDIASVSNGLITANSYGTAYITATCGELTRTCTVNVDKHPQTIIWDQDLTDSDGLNELTLQAYSTSGLPVTYELTEGNDIAEIQGDKLIVHDQGTVTVEASQPGDRKYYGAISEYKTFHVASGISSPSYAYVTVEAQGSAIVVNGLNDGERVAVYLPTGQQVYGGSDHRIELMPETVYIVKSGGRTYKVATH